jgi:hypothetical protein
VLDKSAVVKAKSFTQGSLPGATNTQDVIRYEWMKAINAGGPKPGIAYRYFEPVGKIDLSVISNSSPAKTGVAQEISEKVKQRKKHSLCHLKVL